MKLIRKYNFAKAQNPQSGGSTKLSRNGDDEIFMRATLKKINYVKLN
jgi:hypothetical protein